MDEARNVYQIECAYGDQNVRHRTAVVERGGRLRLRLMEDHIMAASFELVMVDNKGTFETGALPNAVSCQPRKRMLCVVYDIL